MRSVLLTPIACALLAQDAWAQAAPPPARADSARLHGEFRTAIARLTDAELAVTARLDARTDSSSAPKVDPAVRDRHAKALATARALLDTVVLQRPWGGAMLQSLRNEHRGSALLDRYDAALAVRDGRLGAALERYDALLHDHSTDAELHRERGDVLRTMGNTEGAIPAWERALELGPEDEAVYGRLRAAHTDAGSLEQLLAQVRRLRVRRAESTILRDREIELLHRLGRLEDAAKVAGARP
jgi:predicted Zn-dependent protease